MSDIAILPSIFDISVLFPVKSSVSTVDAAPVMPADRPHSPAPEPSEIHTSPALPGDVIKYSLFSTLLADRVPSAKSVKSAS